jgi:hypothetical protein
VTEDYRNLTAEKEAYAAGEGVQMTPIFRVGSILMAASFALAVQNCSPPSTDSEAAAGLSETGSVVVAPDLCQLSGELPTTAYVREFHGPRQEPPSEIIWEGELRPRVSSYTSTIELFEAYDYVSGPLGDVEDLSSLADSVVVTIVLATVGAAGFSMSEARANPDLLFFGRDDESFTGNLETLRATHC